MELLKDVQKYFPIKEFRFSQKQIIEQIYSEEMFWQFCRLERENLCVINIRH